MKIVLIIIPLLMLLAGGTCVRAGDTDLEKMPGYVDLEKIQIPSDAEEVTDIDLGPEILKMALGVSDEENPEIVEALSKIQSIRVKAFELDEEHAEEVRSQFDEIAKRLKADDWNRLIHIKSGDEIVNVNVKHDGENIVGLMVMVYESDSEAVFVNIVGEIDLSLLAKLANEFEGVDLDIDLESLLEEAQVEKED